MDLQQIKALVAFNGWFWASLAAVPVQFVLTMLFAFRYKTTYDPIECFILASLLVLSNALDLILAVLDIRKGPIFDFGFNAAILAPTVAFYLVLGIFVRAAYQVLKHPLFTNIATAAVKKIIVCLLFFKIIVSFAYSSPSGLAICFASLFVNLILFIIWPAPQKKKTE